MIPSVQNSPNGSDIKNLSVDQLNTAIKDMENAIRISINDKSATKEQIQKGQSLIEIILDEIFSRKGITIPN